MNKLISKIVGVALGLTLATGVGAGVVLGKQSFEKAEAAAIAGTFTKVTSVSDISAGDTVIFVNSAGTHALGDLSATSSGYGKIVAVTETDSSITLASATTVTQFAVEAGASSGFAFKAQNNTNFSNYYMAYTSTSTSKNNYLNRYANNSSSNTQGQFTLSYSTDHMVIKSVYNSGRYLRFNNDRFACYYNASAESSIGTGVNIYKYVPNQGGSVYPTSISCSNQTISVTDSLELATQVSFTPSNTTEQTLSFAIASGSDYIDLDTTTGTVVGKKSGTATVTITPDSTGGATAIKVTITVNAIASPTLTIGDQYALYAVDETNSYEGELTGVSNNAGTVATISNETPSCNYLLEVENGYFENTVAFALSNGTYLSYSGTSNELKTESSVTATSSWKVTWDSSTNAAVILNAAKPTRSLQFNYNNASPKFACYTSTQVSVCLYHYEVKALTDFTIDASISVYKTGTATIGVAYTPADAADKTLTWTTSDATVATVADGVVTGVEVGTCTVTASKVIGGITVERTCAVTVLNNKAAHLGTSADPFDINDAVNVAKGIIVETSNGTAIDLTNTYYYVKGILTKYVTRTTSTLTFWLGDEASQQSAATGGFEIFKAAKVYGSNLADAYTADSEVVRDFAVGYTIKASGKLKNYNGTPEMDTGGYIYYNNYIEARKYAEAFNTALEAVCDADGNTVAADLESAWSAQATAYAALDATLEQPILKNATAKTTSSATAVELCAAKYDYILGKYGTTTLSNFIARTVSPSSANLRFAALANNNTALVVVAITAFIGVTFIGGYFFLRKKKEN